MRTYRLLKLLNLTNHIEKLNKIRIFNYKYKHVSVLLWHSSEYAPYGVQEMFGAEFNSKKAIKTDRRDWQPVLFFEL